MQDWWLDARMKSVISMIDCKIRIQRCGIYTRSYTVLYRAYPSPPLQHIERKSPRVKYRSVPTASLTAYRFREEKPHSVIIKGAIPRHIQAVFL